MAAVATNKTVKVTINEIEIEVPAGELIVEAVKRLGLEIPVFCYHSRMKPVGMCRMCLVEVGFKQADGSVRKMPKPQAGCTLPASEGMVINTETEMVHRDRKGVLEFLLVNHPLDCPICDRGGECPLQNNTLAYGPSTSRFIEMKRHLPKAYPLSDFVMLDLERCIQCGRCVRFTEEISGDHQLAFRFRGSQMQPSTFQLTNFESKFSGNVIEICPVGALTNHKYRFRARPWDLESRKGLCALTPDGTNLWMDVRSGKLVRVNGRTNESVNEEWTCDKTKFGHDFYNSSDRLLACNSRSGDEFKRVSWTQAYQELAAKFVDQGCNVAIIAAPTLSNESLFSVAQVGQSSFGTTCIDSRMDAILPGGADASGRSFAFDEVQTTIEELEHQQNIVVFGCSLADDQPMTFLRVRKAWFKHGAKVSVISDLETEVDSFADAIVRVGSGNLEKAAQEFAAACGVSVAGVKPGDAIQSLVKQLQSGFSTLVTTYRLMQSEDGAKAIEWLAKGCEKIKASYLVMKNQANAEGAAILGVNAPNAGCNTRQILEACAQGRVKALWLVGSDPIKDFPDKELARAALENVEYLVVQAGVTNESTAYASLVLPMTLPAEEDGTYTSSERRVQRMNQPLQPQGEAKPAWQVFQEIASRVKKSGSPLFNPTAIRGEIARNVASLASMTDADLEGDGVLLDRNSFQGEWRALTRTASTS